MSLSKDRAAFLAAARCIWLPLRGTAATQGVLAIGRVNGRPPFSAPELAMAAAFAAHASVAAELAHARVAEHKVKLLEERDRIAVDLNEHVISDLFALGLSLVGVADRVRNDAAVTARIRQCVDATDKTISQLRASIFGLRRNGTPGDGEPTSPPVSPGSQPTTTAWPARS
jgi:signal transduction histidine kinase